MVGNATRGPYAVDRWLEAEDVRDIREHFFISVGKHMQELGRSLHSSSQLNLSRF